MGWKLFKKQGFEGDIFFWDDILYLFYSLDRLIVLSSWLGHEMVP